MHSSFRHAVLFWLPCAVWSGCGDSGPPREAPTEPPVEIAETAEPATPADTPPAVEPVEPTPLDPRPSAHLPGETPFDHDALIAALQESRATEFKPVGNSSVVFRMRMDGEHTAAFRPRTRRHRHGAEAELVAYRIGRFLGLENVVPAAERTIPRRRIRDRLHRRYTDEWEELEDSILWTGGYEVPGAAIYWVPAMEDIGLDTPERRREWGDWLAVDGALPENQRRLAQDLSSMVVFDYLIGNWDRFSGGNLKVVPSPDADHPRVILRDHNAALPTALSDTLRARMRDDLRSVQRFSRDLTRRVNALDRARLDEFRGELPISDTAIEGVLERRAVVTSHVGALLEQHGDTAVFAFD